MKYMKGISTITLALAVATSLSGAIASAQTCIPTSRKGVATYIQAGSKPNAIDQLNIHWWYDWSPAQNNYGTGYTGKAIYVPEFWNTTSANLLPLSGVPVAASSPWVFTFNEPDVSSQSNLSVSQAIQAWPTVMADSDSKLIGAPDVSNYDDGWLISFMSSASAAGDKVDFLALHEYPEGDGTSLQSQVATFENFITEVHNAYPSYPIVLNEFALVHRSTWDGTGVTAAEQIAFINQVVPWLESQSYILGYSWYAAYLGYYSSDLLNSDGSLSSIGTAYSNVGCVGSATIPANPSTSVATYTTDAGFTANWSTSAGANQYVLWLFNPTWQELGVYYLGNVGSYPITGLAANTQYEYCVTAGNAAGFSTCGNSTAVTTGAAGGTVPSAPTTAAASAITSSGYTANWTSVSGATQYIVYEFNSSWGQLGAFSVGNVTSYPVTGQATGTAYYYCVVAGNSAGYSSCANSVSVTTN